MPIKPPFQAGEPVADSTVDRYRGEAWYQAYMAALFEADGQQVRVKIDFARRLMLKREIQVFREETCPGERNALNQAFHALQVLQASHKSRLPDSAAPIEGSRTGGLKPSSF